jgi:sulfur carrier protein ThiS adenylyltransferase
MTSQEHATSQEPARTATADQLSARAAAFANANACDPRHLASKQELEAALFERHTPQVQAKLDAAHVAIAGLGGLGSTIAVALTRIGVGHLHLVDFDRVDMSNLNRQQYFLKDLGQLKTEALRSNLAQINPYVEVRIDSIAVDEHNAASLFAQDEIIAEAFDVPENKSMLVNAVREHLPQAQLLSASGMAGFSSANSISTRRVSKGFYFCGDGVSAPLEGEGLMAPRVGVVACHEANMITRLILGQQDA